VNAIAQIARGHGRDYITSEDIREAFETIPVDIVRLHVLEILGNGGGVGAEDSTLCAFVAWSGPEK